MNQTIAIFGATSAIAKEYCRLKSESSNNFILVGRNGEALEDLRADLLVRQTRNVQVMRYDFENIHDQKDLAAEIFKQKVDISLFSFGTLPDQEKCKIDPEYLTQFYQTNVTSNISLVGQVAEKMKQQRFGTIAFITSVAGDRGKKSNYYYGAAKSAMSVFLQGLRQELEEYGVQVLEVKPGFVDTPMTAGFDKGMLWAKPQSIARGIDRAILKKKNVVYLPFFWKHIMCIIKSIPESIFKKMKL